MTLEDIEHLGGKKSSKSRKSKAGSKKTTAAKKDIVAVPVFEEEAED
jgi:hypothetical protein